MYKFLAVGATDHAPAQTYTEQTQPGSIVTAHTQAVCYSSGQFIISLSFVLVLT